MPKPVELLLYFTIGYSAVILYWVIGVLVSFADLRIRNWLTNHPRWRITPPAGIKPSIVTTLWVIYLPMVAVRILGWLFSSGTLIIHKLLADAIDGVDVERK
jgi:ABC-type phosphate transport system permease subunit